MSKIIMLVAAFVLSGCASGQLDLYNAKGKKVGECTAGYDWHLYGVEHSVDWLLNWCAQNAIKEGIEVATVSDPSILQKDYAYPKPASGTYWTKKTSYKAFRSDVITEKEYGYILADIENEFYKRNQVTQQKFAQGKINEDEFHQLMKASKLIFYGN